MRTRVSALAVGGLAAALALAAWASRDSAALAQKQLSATDKANEADRTAVEKSSRDFAAAFDKGDAKAVAAQWTEQGEYHHGAGVSLRGRANIEKAFAEFFKERKPGSKVEVLIDSIRFPAPDLAIEEGLLRHSGTGKELPTTTLYQVMHVRDKSGWKIAVSREWGAGQDRIEDLDWLVGTWKAAPAKGQEMTLTFSRDAAKPFLVGTFTRKADGKELNAGKMKIAIDPQRGQLRSWHFDDDGGHGQALWLRDGNNWVLDAVGVTGGGAETASVNILGRVNSNEITWRSIDRVLGGRPVPDTVPIRLTRASSK